MRSTVLGTPLFQNFRGLRPQLRLLLFKIIAISHPKAFQIKFLLVHFVILGLRPLPGQKSWLRACDAYAKPPI